MSHEWMTLKETPEEFWGNHILYRLAEALGCEVEPGVRDGEPVPTIVADPDEILVEALEIIWSYMDMADS